MEQIASEEHKNLTAKIVADKDAAFKAYIKKEKEDEEQAKIDKKEAMKKKKQEQKE